MVMPEKITDQSQDRTSGDICKDMTKTIKNCEENQFISVFSQNDGNLGDDKLEDVSKCEQNKRTKIIYQKS